MTVRAYSLSAGCNVSIVRHLHTRCQVRVESLATWAGKNAAGLKNRGKVEDGRYSAFETKHDGRKKWLLVRLKGWNFVKELAWISHSRLADETERMSDWIFYSGWRRWEIHPWRVSRREKEKREFGPPPRDWPRFSPSIFNLRHLHIEISVLISPLPF